MKYKFSELIEVAKVQRLNDLFYTATGIPAAVIDLGGAIITCSGWQEICTKFHRVNEGTAQQCVESDTVFANQIGVGQKYTVYKCGNGLVVAASPIAIGDEHVANFITSQFLFHPPDRDSFLEQAKRFGFDEAAYMEAAAKIPVVDESKLQPFLEYFSEFTAMLGEMGLKQLKQIEATAALREREQRWASTLSSVGDAVIATDKDGRITFMNTAAEGLTGWTLTEAAAKPVTEVFNIINERTCKAVDNPVTKVLQKGIIVGLANDTMLLSRDGKEIPIDDSGAPIRDAAGNIIGVVLVFRDITERKAAGEALRESQTRMNRAQEIAHLGSWELDLVNNRLSWSDEVYRIFGLQPREFGATYDAFLEAVHPDDRAAVDAAYTGSLREGRDIYEIEHRVIRKSSGEVRVVHEKCEHLRDHTGRIVKSVGMIHDITERKRAEQELREARAELERKVAERTAELQRSGAYLAEAQRLSHTGSWAFDLASGKFVYASEECIRMYEHDAQEGLPTREATFRLIHPEDRDSVQGGFEKALREKVDTSSEFRLVLPSGTIKHVQTIRHPVLNEAGDVVELVGTTIDITERKRAEEERRQSAERFRAIADYTYDWEHWIGVDGKLLWVNPAVERITGYSVSECMAMPDFPIPIVAEADRQTAARQIREAVQGSSRNDFEFRVRHKDGHLAWVAASWQPIYDSRGARLGYRSSIRDIIERKQAEDRLRHTAEALRRIEAYLAEGQRLSHTGSWAWSLATGQSLYWSEEMFRIFGLNPQEGVPTAETFWKRIHPEDLDRTYELLLMKAAPGNMDYEHEHRIVLPDGTIKHIHAIGHPVLDANGQTAEYVGTAMDVTERKRAEEALRLAGVYNRSLIEASLDPLVTIDKEGKISDVNAATEQVTGYPRSELIGTDFSDYFTEPEKARSGYRKVFSEGLVRDYELKIRHRDGKITPVIYNASVYRDEAGNAIGVFAAARDIRERKRAEAEINNLKNYLSNIIDSMPSILVGMDNTRTVTQWNRQAEAFTGIPAGEAIGKPIADLLPDFAPWIMTMGTDMEEHRPSSMEKILIAKEGERRFYDLMLYPLLVDYVEGAVMRIEDVTERARIQELMVQTEKMMSIGGLAAGMSHEINNPLGIITQAAQNIERRISLELPANRKVSEELGLNLEGIRAYFDKRQISDAIASIRTASSRAAKIVANMLQFSRRADTTMEFTSLAQIVNQALELAASDYDLKKKFDFRSIEIIKDYQDTPQVPIVSVEIEQVILNLLRNAAQAMIANPPDRRPSITFRLRCEGRYAVLDVEDNGLGMTENIRRRVFEPFFTTKEPGVGTGLGLSVAYMIVTQNHKGLMEVQSTPGRGTVFTVRLPIGGEQT